MSLDSILRNAATIAVEVGGVAYIALNILSPMAPATSAARAYHPQQDSRAAIAYPQKAETQYQDGFKVITPLDATPPGYVVRIPRMIKNVSGEVLEVAEKLPPNEEYEKLKKEAMEDLDRLTFQNRPLSEVLK